MVETKRESPDQRERESGVIVCECKRQNDYMCVNGMPHTPQTGPSLSLSLSRFQTNFLKINAQWWKRVGLGRITSSLLVLLEVPPCYL